MFPTKTEALKMINFSELPKIEGTHEVFHEISQEVSCATGQPVIADFGNKKIF